ncbi:MAG: hypothetical protein KDA32_01375 [Phycisphaerales bacterium]|nr:hypothetical protein [Phycisphaerales bacterium]
MSMADADRLRDFEELFLGQIEAKARGLTGRSGVADRVYFEPTREGPDAVRAELGRLRVYDRDAMDRVAGTRSIEMRFQRKLLGLIPRTVSLVRVRTLMPIEAMIRGEEPKPATRADVLVALAHYELIPTRLRPTGVILASPTGFTEEAQNLVESTNHLSLVLIGGRADGGWDINKPKRLKGTKWEKLFELETQPERLKRLLYHLDQAGVEVDSRGLSVSELSQRLGLERAETERLVRQACNVRPRLMTVSHNGETHLARSPLAEEGDSMSWWSRIRKLLGFKPTVAERVRDLSAQRVRIEQQRVEYDSKIDRLEADERGALEQGAAAKSTAEKKQVAGRLMRLRRELQRHRAQAQLLTRQIDVIGTHIHHLTLKEQGRRLELPTSEELTREAAEAEQIMTEISANAELAGSIEVTGETLGMADEEAAIFAEFDEIAEGAPAAKKQAEARDAAPPEQIIERAGEAISGRSAENPPRTDDRSRARPEAS